MDAMTLSGTSAAGTSAAVLATSAALVRALLPDGHGLADLPLPRGGKAVVGRSGFAGLVLPGRDGRPVLVDLGSGCRAFGASYVARFREAGWPVIDLGEPRTLRLMSEAEDCPPEDVVAHLLSSRGVLAAAEVALSSVEPSDGAGPAWRP